MVESAHQNIPAAFRDAVAAYYTLLDATAIAPPDGGIVSATTLNEPVPLDNWIRWLPPIHSKLWRQDIQYAGGNDEIDSTSAKPTTPERMANPVDLLNTTAKRMQHLQTSDTAFVLYCTVGDAKTLVMGTMPLVGDFALQFAERSVVRISMKPERGSVSPRQNLTLQILTKDKTGAPVTTSLVEHPGYSVVGLQVQWQRKPQKFTVYARFVDTDAPKKVKTNNITNYFTTLLGKTEALVDLREPFLAGDPNFLPRFGTYLANQWGTAIGNK